MTRLDYITPTTYTRPGLTSSWIVVTLVWAFIWIFLAIVFLGCISTVPLFFINILLGPFSPFVGILFLLIMVFVARRVRRRRAMAILTYVEYAVRINLPIPGVIMSAALSESGILRRRLLRLQEVLEQGAALPDALEHIVREIPLRHVAILRAAEPLGQLVPALRRLLDERRQEPPVGTVAFRYAYPLALALVSGGVVTMLGIIAVPRLETIFCDFGMRLPGVTLFVLACFRNLAVPMAAILVVITIAIVSRSLAEVFVVPSSRRLLGRLLDPIAWRLPLVGSGVRDRSMADLCQFLGDALDTAVPMNTALHRASFLRLNSVACDQAEQWREGIEAGQSIHDAARNAQLPRMLVGLIGTTQATAETPAVFHFLARYYRTRFSRTRLLLSGAAIPLLALVMGTIVGTTVVAFFVPMVSLIHGLVDQLYRSPL